MPKWVRFIFFTWCSCVFMCVCVLAKSCYDVCFCWAGRRSPGHSMFAQSERRCSRRLVSPLPFFMSMSETQVAQHHGHVCDQHHSPTRSIFPWVMRSSIQPCWCRCRPERVPKGRSQSIPFQLFQSTGDCLVRALDAVVSVGPGRIDGKNDGTIYLLVVHQLGYPL